MKKSIYMLLCAAALVSCGQPKQQQEAVVDVATSGNPIFEGWYADPEGVVFDDEYWIYPTLSDIPFGADSADFPGLQKETRAIHQVYNIQTYMDAILLLMMTRYSWMLFHQKIWSTGLSIPKCCLLRI